MKIPFIKRIDLHFMKIYLNTAIAVHLFLLLVSIIGNLTQQQEDVKQLFGGGEHDLLEALKIYFQYHIVIVTQYLLELQYLITTATLMGVFCVMDKNLMAESNRISPIFPLLAGGLPRHRVARPFFIISITVTLCLCLAEEVFYANCQNWPGADSRKFTEISDTRVKKNIPQYDDITTINFYGNNVDLENGTFENGRFILTSELTRSLPDVLEAGKVQWKPAWKTIPGSESETEIDTASGAAVQTGSREHLAPENFPAGYILRNIRELKSKTWLPNALQYQFELKFPDKTRKMPIFYTENELYWLAKGEIFIISTIPPRNLVDLKKKNMPMSLMTIIRELSVSAQVKPQSALYTEFHFRILRPVRECAFIFCILPIILSSRIPHKLLIGLYQCFALLFYYAMGVIGNSLIVHYGFPPAVGAWFQIAAVALAAAVLSRELYS